MIAVASRMPFHDPPLRCPYRCKLKDGPHRATRCLINEISWGAQLREQGFVPISRRVTSGERLGEVLTCWREDASCVGMAELEPVRHPRAHPRSPTARRLAQRADQQLLSPFCPGGAVVDRSIVNTGFCNSCQGMRNFD